MRPEGVVDALEAIEFEEQHRRALAGLQRRTQAFEKPLAVRQAGEVVETEELLDAVFGGVTLTQVVDADVGEGLVATGHLADGDIDRNFMTLAMADAGLESERPSFAHLAPSLRQIRRVDLRVHVRHAQSQQRLALEAQQAAGGCVGIAKGAVRTDLEERVVGLLDGMAGEQQLALRLLSVADVTRRRDQPAYAAIRPVEG